MSLNSSIAMDILARIRILTEEIQAIALENKRYLRSDNRRDMWQQLQHKQRRERLEEIKEELGLLKRRNYA